MKFLVGQRVKTTVFKRQLCQLCGRYMEGDHVMRCCFNKVYRNLRHNDTVIGFVSTLHKQFRAEAVCAQNGNVLADNMQPDILFTHQGQAKYIDITYVANEHKVETVFNEKITIYKDYVDVIIPVVIRYNGVIYDKSITLLNDITTDQKTWNNLYKHIYNAISRNWISAERNCLQKIDVMMEQELTRYDLMVDKDEEYAELIYPNEKKDNQKELMNELKRRIYNGKEMKDY